MLCPELFLLPIAEVSPSRSLVGVGRIGVFTLVVFYSYSAQNYV